MLRRASQPKGGTLPRRSPLPPSRPRLPNTELVSTIKNCETFWPKEGEIFESGTLSKHPTGKWTIINQKNKSAQPSNAKDVFVWIDFNKDAEFTDNEKVFGNYCVSGCIRSL